MTWKVVLIVNVYEIGFFLFLFFFNFYVIHLVASEWISLKGARSWCACMSVKLRKKQLKPVRNEFRFISYMSGQIENEIKRNKFLKCINWAREIFSLQLGESRKWKFVIHISEIIKLWNSFCFLFEVWARENVFVSVCVFFHWFFRSTLSGLCVYEFVFV